MEFQRILDYKIEEITANHGLIIDNLTIEGLKVKEFVKKDYSYFSYIGISERYLNEIIRILSLYNLKLSMTDFEIKIFESNPNSIFLKTQLADLFNSSIVTILNRRGIYNLSELVLFTERKLSKSNENGRLVTMQQNTIDRIKEVLTKLGLSLGMKEVEIINFGIESETKTRIKFWQRKNK